MKKHLLSLVVIISFLTSSIFAQTVYVTKTGQKNHKETCRYLSKSSFEIKLSEVNKKGYGPCSVCKPKTVSTSPSSNPTQPQEKNSQSVQCTAITKAGSQCQRTTKSLNKKCWQHGGN